MKTLVLFASILFCSNVLFSQFGNPNLIAGNDTAVVVTATGDFDNDGDVDIVSGAIYNIGGLKWYANDGVGNFSSANQIPNVEYVRAIETSDLDGDDDLDIVLAYQSAIAWLENDGLGNFSAPIVISDQVSYPTDTYCSDLDNDGDIDVLSASAFDDKIAWYENNGSGSFSEELIITTNAEYAKAVVASDLDNDGDLDVLSASIDDNKLAWYENNGLGEFGDQIIVSEDFESAKSVISDDFDGDGDKDIVASKSVFIEMFNISYVTWFANDGSGNFGPEQTISSNIPHIQTITSCDLDNDEDIDILAACHSILSFNGDLLAWYENDGFGNFSDEQSIHSGQDLGIHYVDFADLDMDGDLDVISSLTQLNDLVWFENQVISDIQEEVQSKIELYPNPMTETSYLFFNQACSNCSVRLMNSSGQIVREYENISEQKLSIERKDLAAGTYILQVLEGGREIKEFVLIVN